MSAKQLQQMNELAGRVEAVGRALMHLAARLEDDGLIDGPDYTAGLRQSIALGPDASILMQSARRTLASVADAMDEARDWRRFRRQAVAPAGGNRKAG